LTEAFLSNLNNGIVGRLLSYSITVAITRPRVFLCLAHKVLRYSGAGSPPPSVCRGLSKSVVRGVSSRMHTKVGPYRRIVEEFMKVFWRFVIEVAERARSDVLADGGDGFVECRICGWRGRLTEFGSHLANRHPDVVANLVRAVIEAVSAGWDGGGEDSDR